MTTSVNNNVGNTGTSNTASTASATSAALGNTMDQADFLKLLTTQLQAQDPTNPTDNSQFVSQLAQFSQLASTQDLNTSLNSLSSQITGALQTSQVLGSVGLVGRHVLVPSASLSYAGSALSGAVGITNTASDVQLVIKDGSGKVVRTLDLGAQQSGLANFSWDGTDDDGNPVPAGDYSITAADQGGNALSTYADGTVSGVGYGGSDVGTYVQVSGVGGVPLSAIAQIN
ncbi:flagellar hook assembly protein FlgD [Rhodanobacter geophilus]|uniref:Basal-body rod modification protein FlgD n=1 Tax=Rhodanobacter geophilus TaxID=3162488 RepID=A0ABV3QSI6_9GAMM